MKRKVRILLHSLILALILTVSAGTLTVHAENEMKINLRTATVNIGDELDLKIEGQKEGDKKPRWVSYNVNVASVDQDGTVTALRKGTSIISSGIGFPRETCVVKVVDPTIKINKKEATIYYYPSDSTETKPVNSITLKATVKGAAKDVVWSSDNEKVAKVEKDAQGRGVVTSANKAGTAVITAEANGRKASCKVTVVKSKISLNINEMKLSAKGAGSSIKLTPTVVGARKSVTWTSSDPTVATVKGGKVTGKKSGTATIDAIANGVKATCVVTVEEGTISINEENILLYVKKDGDTVQGETKTLKTNASGSSQVKWGSSNEAVATVDDNGCVTAKGAGKAVIIAESEGKTDTCKVEVKNTGTAILEKAVALRTKGDDKTYNLAYQIIGRKTASKWKSSNTKVVSVSKGKLTAKKAGTATVTLEANGITDEVQITVRDFTPTIALNQKEYTLYTKGKGTSVALKATVNGANKKVEWESKNTDVAVVKNGKVTAKAAGRTLITATANGVTSKCWVSVREPKIVLEKDELLIKAGQKQNLCEQTSMEILGANQSVTYKSSNAGIAAINKKGVITAKKKGAVTITIKANGVEETCNVTVSECETCTFGEAVTVRKASCEENGLVSYTCTVCGGKKQEVTDPLGHRYGKWVVVANATENAAGLQKQVCIRPGCDAENTRVIPVKVKEGFRLVWEDDFDGDSLNTDDWNYEYHEPGWVNAELQEYVDSPENIYVKDGNLVIQAIKKGEGDSASYTSGRINTQNKHDYTYGRFEVRAKVPSGKGFLPAFWMMPTDESYYGQWPKCGEIDIMEVMGQETDKLHGTLHFGEPHTQKQGTYTLPATEQDFAEDFHVFACEWEPGEFRYYVDGRLYFTENDWFTKKSGFGEAAYPAPYDQPFYMILNLAVGGSWVGYPDENTKFEDNAQLVVDYVRVYQRDSYDTDVKKPDNKVELRDPDETGNYIINGDFAKVEDLAKGDENWQLLLTGGGEGTAEIAENALHITTTEAGTLDYSVQIVQADLPIEKGSKYRLSFDAYADEARTMKTGITAPDRGYIRYLNDTVVDLTTESKPFEYFFDMKSDSDANGRVEFNLGNQGSTAKVHITNVRLEKAGEAEEEKKSILPDGNYVYNGSFDEGNEPGRLRLDYWDVDYEQCRGANISVTDDSRRELKVVVPGTATLEQVTVKQTEIAIKGGKQYVLSFDAYADEEKTIQSSIAGQTFESNLTTDRTEYKYEFETAADLDGSELKFLLGVPGTTYIDNVCIRENGLIVNGDFSSGMTGYEVYVNEAAKVPNYIVDSLNEKDAFSIDIADTGNQDWYIQLKQNNIKLEKDKWYKIAFDAKSTKDRQIMYALQRDGSNDDNWIPYSGTQKINLTKDYQNFSHVFKMANDTDPKTILSISMGAVGGTQVADKHTVVIDNITLEETEAQEEPPVVVGENMITNGDFAQGSTDWTPEIGGSAAATTDFENGKAVFNITNVGENDWDVKLKHDNNLTLENGATYKVTMKIKSTEARTVKYSFMTSSYAWYGGEDLKLTANEEKPVDYEFTVDKDTSSDITFSISMGKIEGEDTPASTIEIDNICVVKVSGGETPDENLIKNGDFAQGSTGWTPEIGGSAAATTDFENGKAVFNITNVGENDWDVKLKHDDNLTLESGATYKVTMKIKSTETRTVKYSFMTSSYAWYGGEDLKLTANEEKPVDYEFTVDKDTSSDITFSISMGKIEGEDTPASTIEIDDICVKKVNGTDTPGEEIDPVEIGTELIKNGDFANGKESWTDAVTAPGAADVNFDNGKATFDVTNVGTADWNVQLKQSGLTMEKGARYKMNLKLKSTADRTVKLALLDPKANYAYYGGADIELHADMVKTVSRIITVENTLPSVNTIDFVISMGKIENVETPVSTIVIDDISIIKVDENTAADEEKEELENGTASFDDEGDQDDENADDVSDDDQNDDTDDDDQSGNTDDEDNQSGNTDDGDDQSGNTDDGDDQSGNIENGDDQNGNTGDDDDQNGSIDNGDGQSGSTGDSGDQSDNTDNGDNLNGDVSSTESGGDVDGDDASTAN